MRDTLSVSQPNEPRDPMADRLDQLAADLEALKIEFEKYFIGVEKRLPARQRGEVSRAISRYAPGNDAVEKFRHQGLVQRLSTYNRYWNRILRAIEEGTYERDRFKADYRAKQKEQTAPRASARDEAEAKKAASEVGDAAADFLASLTGSGPQVGLRGKPVGERPSDARPLAVGMRGRSVADRPSVDTRSRAALTPGKGFAPQPATPAPGLRGRPVGDSGGRPAVSAPPSRPSSGRPAVSAPPSRPSGERPAASLGGKPGGLSNLGGLSRSGGLVGGLSKRPSGSGPSLTRPEPPAAPKPPSAPSPPAPRGRPVPRGRPAPRGPATSASSPSSGPARSVPAPPMRGAAKAPPAPAMRGAPKAPMRGRPVDDD